MASGPRTVRTIRGAPLAGRRELGALLGQRRLELGYPHWPAFVRERLPPTPSGKPNTRMVADIERAYRDTFPEERLKQLAKAYLVTYESMVAVAHRRASALVPVSPAASAPPPLPGEPAGWLAPMADPARVAACRPYADRIWERLRDLALQGVADPDGARLFGAGSPDAKTWDGTGARLPLPDRVLLIADMQRYDAGRRGGPETGAGALPGGSSAARGRR